MLSSLCTLSIFVCIFEIVSLARQGACTCDCLNCARYSRLKSIESMIRNDGTPAEEHDWLYATPVPFDSQNTSQRLHASTALMCVEETGHFMCREDDYCISGV